MQQKNITRRSQERPSIKIIDLTLSTILTQIDQPKFHDRSYSDDWGINVLPTR